MGVQVDRATCSEVPILQAASARVHVAPTAMHIARTTGFSGFTLGVEAAFTDDCHSGLTHEARPGDVVRQARIIVRHRLGREG